MTKSEKVAAWRKANPEKAKALARRSNARHPERFERWKAKHPLRRRLILLKCRAKKRGIEFTITEEDLEIPEFCPVFGVRLELTGPASGPNRASVDRIDSTKGYVPGNVWVISYRANAIKNDGTPEEHLAIARAVQARLSCE